jgi:hypothetical protein
VSPNCILRQFSNIVRNGVKQNVSRKNSPSFINYHHVSSRLKIQISKIIQYWAHFKATFKRFKN